MLLLDCDTKVMVRDLFCRIARAWLCNVCDLHQTLVIMMHFEVAGACKQGKGCSGEQGLHLIGSRPYLKRDGSADFHDNSVAMVGDADRD